jgi:hypothetical protein
MYLKKEVVEIYKMYSFSMNQVTSKPNCSVRDLYNSSTDNTTSVS